ncbi:MAG: type 4a pilus biogenesis protein PilO [Isosphaeraceae bacterium]
MSEKTSKSSLPRQVLTLLRNPTRLRLALSAAILLSWYFAVYGPTSEYMTLASTRTDSERKRAVTAREIEKLRSILNPCQDRIPDQSGLNELIQYVMAHVRTLPINLIDLKPGKVKDLGPYDNLNLRLQFESTYEDLDALLHWVETNQRLLRVDTLKIELSKEKNRLAVQLELVSLAEKEKNTAAAKSAGAAKTETKR